MINSANGELLSPNWYPVQEASTGLTASTSKEESTDLVDKYPPNDATSFTISGKTFLSD